MRSKYICPFTDFGFKKIFGEEASKPLLMDFLNALLPLEAPIKQLSFRNNEQLGRAKAHRNAVYDIFCENGLGEKFIIEMQKEDLNFFRERTIYYSTFPISEQAIKGPWDFNLKAVFCIGILDFTFSDYEMEPKRKEVVHVVKLKDQHCKVFYEKLTYVYLEMPNFNKKEEELETRLDKWLYFIKHLEDFQTIPRIFKGEVIFKKALEKAALAKLDQSEWISYEYSLKKYRDNFNAMNTAVSKGIKRGWEEGKMKGWEEGKKEGREEGRIEGQMEVMEVAMEEEAKARIETRFRLAKTLKTNGIPIDIISRSTGIIAEELMDL